MQRSGSLRLGRQCALAGATLAALAAVRADAAAYLWTNAAAGGTWSDSTNWTPTGVPAAGDSAGLGNATANRTVVYDTAAPGTLGTLSFTQTSSGVTNAVYVQSNLTIENPLTLGATSGTAQLLIDPLTTYTSAAATSVTVPSITIAGGGNLTLSASRNTANITSTSQINSNVTISGGTLSSDRGYSINGTSNVVGTILNGNLSMTAGTLSVGFNSPKGNTAALNGQPGEALLIVNRMTVNGNLAVTGGAFQARSTNDQLYLAGATNSISGVSTNVPLLVSLVGSADQSFLSDSALSGGVSTNYAGTGSTVNYTIGSVTSTKTLSTTAITLGKGAAGTATLKLATDVAVGTQIALSANQTSGTFQIDTNSRTIDFSNNAITFTPPNATGATTTTTWNLLNTASSGTGVVKAAAFNLATPKGGVNVGANVNLIANGPAASVNNLSNAAGATATIDPASTFTYAGTATAASAARLTSNRTVGNVVIQSGAIQLDSAITTAATSAVTVNASGTLNLNAFALSAGALNVAGTLTGTGTVATTNGITFAGNFSPGGTAVGSIGVGSGALTLAATDLASFDITSASTFDTVTLSGTAVNYGGTLSVNFGYTPVAGQSYVLFAGGVGNGNFSSLTSNLSSEYGLAFDPSSGTLSVSAVPEPAFVGTFAMAGLAIGMRRRKTGEGPLQ